MILKLINQVQNFFQIKINRRERFFGSETTLHRSCCCCWHVRQQQFLAFALINIFCLIQFLFSQLTLSLSLTLSFSLSYTHFLTLSPLSLFLLSYNSLPDSNRLKDNIPGIILLLEAKCLQRNWKSGSSESFFVPAANVINKPRGIFCDGQLGCLKTKRSQVQGLHIQKSQSA